MRAEWRKIFGNERINWFSSILCEDNRCHKKSQLKQELRYYPVTLFAGEEARKVREEMAVNYRNTAIREAKLG